MTPSYQYAHSHNVNTGMDIARVCLYKDDECWIAQYVVNGQKCVPFYVHESTRRSFKSEQEFMDFLEKKACEMLQMYGQVHYTDRCTK